MPFLRAPCCPCRAMASWSPSPSSVWFRCKHREHSLSAEGNASKVGIGPSRRTAGLHADSKRPLWLWDECVGDKSGTGVGEPALWGPPRGPPHLGLRNVCGIDTPGNLFVLWCICLLRHIRFLLELRLLWVLRTEKLQQAVLQVSGGRTGGSR